MKNVNSMTYRPRNRAEALTDGEHTLMHWLTAGHTNSQIGACVGRSEKTIRNRLTRVYAKLGVANRAQAVAVHLRREFARGNSSDA